MPAFNAQEIAKLQNYLQKKFQNRNISLKARDGKATDSAEVTISGEFIGTLYKITDEGETSFDFNMAILDIDLEEAA